jgi:hypothetical protein
MKGLFPNGQFVKIYPMAIKLGFYRPFGNICLDINKPQEVLMCLNLHRDTGLTI